VFNTNNLADYNAVANHLEADELVVIPGVFFGWQRGCVGIDKEDGLD
jgi:hypothetical protein